MPHLHGLEKHYDSETDILIIKAQGALRKAAERTVDGLWNAIGRIIDDFTSRMPRRLRRRRLRCNVIGFRSR